jgi:hypothetical protein
MPQALLSFFYRNFFTKTFSVSASRPITMFLLVGAHVLLLVYLLLPHTFINTFLPQFFPPKLFSFPVSRPNNVPIGGCPF